MHSSPPHLPQAALSHTGCDAAGELSSQLRADPATLPAVALGVAMSAGVDLAVLPTPATWSLITDAPGASAVPAEAAQGALLAFEMPPRGAGK